MKDKDIAMLAIEAEAKKNPDAKIIVGYTVLTYQEAIEKIKSGDKKVTKLILDPLIKTLKEDIVFRKKILSELGIVDR